MQMIGRGMRGVGCGGTQTVNIVDFCDKWSSFTRWLNPKFLTEGEGELPEPVPRQSKPQELIPMELIIAVMRGIKYGNVQITAHDASLPIGWYNVIDEEGNDEKVIVFASQEEGYLAMKADAETLKLTDEFDGAELAKKYFMEVLLSRKTTMRWSK